MRWLLLCILTPLYAQQFDIKPALPRQGQTVRLTASAEAEWAQLGKRKVPLFPDGTGKAGLMPIAVDAKPGEYTLNFLDHHDAVIQSVKITVSDARFPLIPQDIKLPQAVAALKSSPTERQEVNSFRESETPERYWQEPLTLPIPGCQTSPFGVRRSINGKPTGEYHLGVDQRGAAGTQIRPIADGIVRLAAEYNLRGGTVAVDHGQGFTSIYMHMSKVLAKPGDHVKSTEAVGLVGSTGRATAAHLHWTLYVHGEVVDPNQWLHLAPCAPRPAAKPKAPVKQTSPVPKS